MVGSLLFILWYVMRRGLATLAYLRRPYPPDSFTPQQWLECLSDATPRCQDQLLRRTTHQALGLDAKEFLDVLREARGIVQADPALGTYWRTRHDLEQILKQERQG